MRKNIESMILSLTMPFILLLSVNLVGAFIFRVEIITKSKVSLNEPFSVNATIFYSGCCREPSIASDVWVEIILPPGMKLVSGENPIHFNYIVREDRKNVSWVVECLVEGNFNITVKANSTSAGETRSQMKLTTLKQETNEDQTVQFLPPVAYALILGFIILLMGIGYLKLSRHSAVRTLSHVASSACSRSFSGSFLRSRRRCP